VRLVSFEGGFGRLVGDEIVPMGDDLVAYLRTGEATESSPIMRDSVRLSSPVPRPEKIILIGLNYRDHAEEAGQPIPEEPVLFAKFANSLVGHEAAVVLPPETEQVDYEVELGVVIGRRAHAVPVFDALDYVAGYTCMNDLSARDLQFRSGQWTRGKAIDGFHPTGPCLVTTDEIPDPQDLAVSCRVNGEALQASSTAQMVFGVAELVSFISRTMTLEPGDLISTGTPAGVGFTREPPIFLRPGDAVEVEIERIGILRTYIADR
jgi:2-keto-4-pentenoate hydratase/2-oxohepta-3-ene-1,7-dioic acid hydratase in catechol pathway